MSPGFILLTATLLFLAFSVESIIKNQSLLNILAAIVILFLSSILGSELFIILLTGMGDLNKTLVLLKLRNALIYSYGIFFFLFSLYFPRDKYSRINIPIFLITMVGILITFFFSFSGLTISKINLTYNIKLKTSSSGNPYFSPIIPELIFNLNTEYNYLHFFLIALSAITGLSGLSFIILKYPKTTLIYQKKQIRYLTSSIMTSLLFLLVSFILKSRISKTFFYLMLVFSCFTGALGIFYSVISYRFANLRKRVISSFKETLIYLIITLPFAIALSFLRKWVSNLPASTYFLSILAFLLFFIWFQEAAKRFIKKILNINTDLDITELLFDRIGNSRNVEELSKNTINAITELLNVRNAHFYFLDMEREVFIPVYSSSNKSEGISALEPFFRHIKEKGDIYDREIINFDPHFKHIRDIANRYFEKYNVALMIPLFYENLLSALINLEYKIDGNSFSKEETAILLRLKKVCSITLRNIILFEKEEEAKLTRRDITLASQIQESIFQREIPVFKNIDIFAYQKPAKEVSGDYFFIKKIDENRAGFILADVSGKGFSAALVSMMIHTISQSEEFSPSLTNMLINKINEVMTSNTTYNRVTRMLSFATIFSGYIDKENGVLYYSSAGHHPAIIYEKHKDNFKLIKATSRPAGIFKEETFHSQKVTLQKGDTIVIYTDGIIEAINKDEEEFGLERLKKIIKENHHLSTRELTYKIIEKVEEFAGEVEQYDDITLITIKL